MRRLPPALACAIVAACTADPVLPPSRVIAWKVKAVDGDGAPLLGVTFLYGVGCPRNEVEGCGHSCGLPFQGRGTLPDVLRAPPDYEAESMLTQGSVTDEGPNTTVDEIPNVDFETGSYWGTLVLWPQSGEPMVTTHCPECLPVMCPMTRQEPAKECVIDFGTVVFEPVPK